MPIRFTHEMWLFNVIVTTGGKIIRTVHETSANSEYRNSSAGQLITASQNKLHDWFFLHCTAALNPRIPPPAKSHFNPSFCLVSINILRGWVTDLLKLLRLPADACGPRGITKTQRCAIKQIQMQYFQKGHHPWQGHLHQNQRAINRCIWRPLCTLSGNIFALGGGGHFHKDKKKKRKLPLPPLSSPLELQRLELGSRLSHYPNENSISLQHLHPHRSLSTVLRHMHLFIYGSPSSIWTITSYLYITVFYTPRSLPCFSFCSTVLQTASRRDWSFSSIVLHLTIRLIWEGLLNPSSNNTN